MRYMRYMRYMKQWGSVCILYKKNQYSLKYYGVKSVDYLKVVKILRFYCLFRASSLLMEIIYISCCTWIMYHFKEYSLYFRLLKFDSKKGTSINHTSMSKKDTFTFSVHLFEQKVWFTSGDSFFQDLL